VLRRVPEDQCRRPEASVADSFVQFRPGDYSPAIKNIGSQLAKLGYLSAPSDALYSNELSAAMREFQLNSGLTPTGLADVKSIRALRIRTITSGGC
jgi:peptidoglycan hydrolase-like protein with peptidoglycan-binding domain